MFGSVFQDTNGQNHGDKIEDPVEPLERNLYGHPLAGLQRECKPIETIIEQYIKMFESRIFLLERQKITGMAETCRTNGSVVPRHGRTCSKTR